MSQEHSNFGRRVNLNRLWRLFVFGDAFNRLEVFRQIAVELGEVEHLPDDGAVIVSSARLHRQSVEKRFEGRAVHR